MRNDGAVDACKSFRPAPPSASASLALPSSFDLCTYSGNSSTAGCERATKHMHAERNIFAIAFMSAKLKTTTQSRKVFFVWIAGQGSLCLTFSPICLVRQAELV